MWLWQNFAKSGHTAGNSTLELVHTHTHTMQERFVLGLIIPHSFEKTSIFKSLLVVGIVFFIYHIRTLQLIVYRLG